MVLTNPAVSASSISIACQAWMPGPGTVAPSCPLSPNTASRNRHARAAPRSWAITYPMQRLQGKSPRSPNAIDTTGFRWAPETPPMNRMIAMTVRPGAVTAAVRLIWPPDTATHHRAAGAGHDEQERAQDLREQPAPLERRIVEVEGGGALEGQHGAPRPVRVVAEIRIDVVVSGHRLGGASSQGGDARCGELRLAHYDASHALCLNSAGARARAWCPAPARRRSALPSRRRPGSARLCARANRRPPQQALAGEPRPWA